MQEIRLTIKEAAESIQRQFGGKLCPDWALRRIVDEMEKDNRLNVQRAGLYRTVSVEDLGRIADELRKHGRLESEAVECN